MPKKPTSRLLAQWRQLAAEGLSYREVGERTEWDYRTVRKYLEKDFERDETYEIRRDLFKERLGQHWDMLTTEVRQALGGLRMLDPWDLLEWMGRELPVEFLAPGSTVTVDAKGNLTVSAAARQLRSWSLLLEHLPRDPLWPAVRTWEQTTAELIKARRALYAEAKRRLAEHAPWPIGEDAPSESVYLTQGAIDVAYESRLCLSLGMSQRRLEFSQLHEDQDGFISTASRRLARAPGKKKKVFAIVSKAVDELADAPETHAAVRVQSKVAEALQQVRSGLEDFRLLPYLPGTCEVCGRTELSAIKTRKEK